MTKAKRIHARCPVRIDLAGGTIDIWPIYLLIPQASTINLGVDLYAETELTVSVGKGRKTGIELISEDQKTSLKLAWSDLKKETPPAFRLPVRLLEYFSQHYPKKIPSYLGITTRAQSPAGAGLGGSSALTITLTAALARWFIGSRAIQDEAAKIHLIEIAKDCESQVLKVPAGLQDYYGAMFGGLQILHWDVAGHRREVLSPSLLQSLEERLVLFYSGQSRNSGINNWILFKSFLDGESQTENLFLDIAAATTGLSEALKKRDWQSVSKFIQKEWSSRRQLAPGISNPKIDSAIQLALPKALQETDPDAELAFKVCGAGGGGCFFILLPWADHSLRQRIVNQICSQGIRDIPFRATAQGLHVTCR